MTLFIFPLNLSQEMSNVQYETSLNGGLYAKQLQIVIEQSPACGVNAKQLKVVLKNNLKSLFPRSNSTSTTLTFIQLLPKLKLQHETTSLFAIEMRSCYHFSSQSAQNIQQEGKK